MSGAWVASSWPESDEPFEAIVGTVQGGDAADADVLVGRVHRGERPPAPPVRLRLSDPARLSEFAGFLAVPRVVVERLDDSRIEVRPTGETDARAHEILVELMLAAWNATHADAPAWIVAD